MENGDGHLNVDATGLYIDGEYLEDTTEKGTP